MKKFFKILALTITILMVSIPVFASESFLATFLTNSIIDRVYDTPITNGITTGIVTPSSLNQTPFSGIR